MGNKDKDDDHDHELYATMPSFFRCPISLDVMTSPVSLCTGVTYDRSSIQRWLDAGHNVCPATMQPLPSTHHLVPNHTLHRLIRVWSSSQSSKPFYSSLSHSQASALVREMASFDEEAGKKELLDRILELLHFASESADNRRFLGRKDALVGILVRQTRHFGDLGLDLEEAVVKLLELIARSYKDDDEEAMLLKLRLLFLQPKSLSSSSRILSHSRPDSKIALANLLRTLASSDSPESQIAVVENESVPSQLILGLNGHSDPNKPDPSSPPESDDPVAAAYLSCLQSLSALKRNKAKIVRAGAVAAVGRLFVRSRRRNSDSSSATDEAAVRLLEALCGCVEGRKAVAEDKNCICGILQRILRVSKEASESGVAMLWALCCVMREQRAKEAVAATANGGLTKIMMMMQSGCSPAAKRMCGDLLRIFRVGSKSCLANYDSKTLHVMPF